MVRPTMDSKLPIHQTIPENRTAMAPRRTSRFLAAILLTLMGVYCFWQYSVADVRPFDIASFGGKESLAQGLVPLEAHIMSKCPDTRVGRTVS